MSDEGKEEDGPGGEGRRRRRRRRGRGGGEAREQQGGQQQQQQPARQQQQQQQQQRQPQQQQHQQGKPQQQRQPKQRREPERDRQRDPERERERDRELERDREPEREREPERDRTPDAGRRTPDAGRRTPDAGRRTPDAGHRTADDVDRDSEPAVEAWGRDDDEPAKAVALAADLPADPPAEDPDPATYELAGATLGDDVASVVGVQVVPAGRVQWCDAGDGDYRKGDRVVVDAERGSRVATVVVPPVRRAVRDRSLRRVLRRANDQDARATSSGERELRIAKDKAAALGLPLKVFRVEASGGRLLVYYTSDERLDVRDFVRELAAATSARIELRQLGARDEAKLVGGIGSCGLTLCCTTWLPEFVPVSIKMAKDQGLVLSPTKVAGQCGRLKCCLVYEQAAYAELRKGLPKLGKRVVTAKGDGRVVEVDVLRQRVRVSYAPGDSEVLPATEVRPMFPSGQRPGAEPEAEAEPEPDA